MSTLAMWSADVNQGNVTSEPVATMVVVVLVMIAMAMLGAALRPALGLLVQLMRVVVPAMIALVALAAVLIVLVGSSTR